MVQPKLAVLPATDVYEQDADHVAGTVMRAPASGAPGGCGCGGACARWISGDVPFTVDFSALAFPFTVAKPGAPAGPPSGRRRWTYRWYFVGTLGRQYCPGSPLTRAQMSILLVRTFDLSP